MMVHSFRENRRQARQRAIEESLAGAHEDEVHVAPYEPEYDQYDWDELFRGILDNASERTDLAM